MCSRMFLLKFFVYSKSQSTHGEHRSQTMREVIVYTRLKTVDNHKNDSPKKRGMIAYRRWSYTRGSKCKALTGKNLVLWIGGRLWQVFA